MNIENLKLYQKINQFPSINELCDKINLCKNYRRMRKKFGANFNYMPTSYILPDECLKFKKRITKEGGFWIVKPPNFCAGQGIRVISKYCQIPRHLPHIIQNYLLKPQLINNLKFDLRLYVLVTCLNPLKIYLYYEGLVRIATEKYLTNSKYLDDKFMHLTNTSINKYSPQFVGNDSVKSCRGNMWSLQSLWTYLMKNNKNTNVPKLWTCIKDIVIKTILTAENSLTKIFMEKLSSSYNAYQLFGFDIIIDENLKPWLLEVNSCPSMVANTPLCDIIKGELTENLLNLVGFHLPNNIIEENEILSKIHGEEILFHNYQLYDKKLNSNEIEKHEKFLKIKKRDNYLSTILEKLTSDDVRILIRHEDEELRRGNFEKIFPTSITFKYFKYFEEQKYYNLLLDSWENCYYLRREIGIERLKKLCQEKYHLRQ